MLSRLRIPNVMLLVLGLLLGWGLATVRPAKLHASGGDRSGESIVATGPILIRYDEGNKVQIPLEALYILDYKAAKLHGDGAVAAPDQRQELATWGRSPSATWWPTSSSIWTTGPGRISS